MKILKYITILIVFGTLAFSCNKESKNIYKPEAQSNSKDEIDMYLQEHFQDKYNCAIRWKWADRYVEPSFQVAPVDRNVVKQTGDMITKFWIEPFILESKKSGEFIRKNFPPEIVFLGSELRNADGTRTLGYADAGVRITLTELNLFNLKNKAWVNQQLHTIHHEFSHIVHQTYKMPVGFSAVSEKSYTGRAWNDIYAHAQNEIAQETAGKKIPEEEIRAMVAERADDLAIQKGMLTPYGTSTEFEDFAELVSIYLLTDPVEFEQKYLANNPAKPHLREGKAAIAQKLTLIKDYYKNNFSIDLEHLRTIILERLYTIEKS